MQANKTAANSGTESPSEDDERNENQILLNRLWLAVRRRRSASRLVGHSQTTAAEGHKGHSCKSFSCNPQLHCPKSINRLQQTPVKLRPLMSGFSSWVYAANGTYALRELIFVLTRRCIAL